MSEVMDWPTIAVEPPAAQARVEPAPVEVLPALQSLREHSLAELSAVERGLAKLKAEHGSTDYDIATPHGYKLATSRRHAVRLVRYLVPKVVKAKRDELNEIRDAVKTEGDRITSALLAIEQPHDTLIQAEDARKENERAEKMRIEDARKERHETALATIRSYASRCAGLTSERISSGITQLENMDIHAAAWEEFAERAAAAKAETLATMHDLHAKTKHAEDEAARLEAQRIENERVAAEQAAERQRIAEAAAKVKADAEALQRRINEQAEREAKAERDAAAVLAAQRAESDRLERKADAERKARIEAQVEAEMAARREEAEALGVRLPNADDADDYSITIGLAAGVSSDEKAALLAPLADERPLYAPLRDPVDPTETLVWRDATATKPSDNRTLLCWGREGFFTGYWDDGGGPWIGCESGGTVLGVTHWSEPQGPITTTKETTC